MTRPAPETPILILDDSLAIRTRVESYLRRLGYKNILTAASIEEGLEAFRKQGSEIVFLDLVVGEERGADFAAQALAEQPLVHVVVMTALPPSHEQVTVSIAEGARDYLPKPVQYVALEAVLERVAESRALDRAIKNEDASYV